MKKAGAKRCGVDFTPDRKMSLSTWKSFRYRLEEIGCRILAEVIPRLPRPVCYALARFLGTLGYYLDRRGRKVALENLRCVFAEEHSENELRRIARESYVSFARAMLDLFWSARITKENYAKYVDLDSLLPYVQLNRESGRGVVFMCVHQGNWEWASLGGGLIGLSNVTVTANFKNPRLTELFRELREKSGQVMVGQDGSLLRMLRAIQRGGTTGLLIDLNVLPGRMATVLEVFRNRAGEPLLLCAPVLHVMLAERLGALLVPAETRLLPDGRWAVITHPPVEYAEGASMHEVAQRCWDAFEPILRARPADYLWAYKHFRFLPSEASRAYPGYANRSKAFEKLLGVQQKR